MPQPQREKYTHIALGKAQRLEGLINEFFDITRYNLQQLILEKEPVDVSYLLVQLTDEFYPLLQAHGNTLELDVPQELTVEGDAGKLARVFNNLLKNAIAYSTPETPIACGRSRQMDRHGFSWKTRERPFLFTGWTTSSRNSSAWTSPAPPPPAARDWGWPSPRRSSPSMGGASPPTASRG